MTDAGDFPAETATYPASESVLRWQRVRGAMLLSAAADGLGARFEGHATVSPGDLDGWMHHSTEPLSWTDDTAQMLVLADHLVRRRGIVHQDGLAAELAAEWRLRPDRGYGTGAAGILGDIAAGGDWRRASAALFAGAGSYGDGAAMRVAPIGLLPGLASSAVAARAARSAEISHRNPVAVDGAVAQAVAVHMALTSPGAAPINPRAFVDRLRPHLHTDTFISSLRRVVHLVEAAAVPAAVAAELGNGAHAGQAVPAALTAFLRHPDDVVAAIRYALLVGGDTDTIAAMTAAVAGARRGERDLPVTWGLRLHAASRVWTTAHALARLAASGLRGRGRA